MATQLKRKEQDALDAIKLCLLKGGWPFVTDLILLVRLVERLVK